MFNPYSPGAGTPPRELAGRESLLEQARLLFGRVKLKYAEKSILLTGLRGVGKTVLLQEMERKAKEMGYRTIFIEALENKTLVASLVPYVRSILLELDRFGAISKKVKKGLSVLRRFIESFSLQIGDITFGIGIDPERETVHSGDLEIDLPNLFVAVAEAAQDRECGIAIFIDELQYLNQIELSALIAAMHKLQRMQLPMVLVGAGLPILPGLCGNAKSYSERLFSYPDIDSLNENDAAKALCEPASDFGISFEADALKEIYRLTRGYPYFLQEWGYQSWNLANSNVISLEIVQKATTLAIPSLDKNFFRVRLDRLTPGEKNFLRAMAEIVDRPAKTSDIIRLLHVKAATLSPVRARLMKKGMIYSPSYGELAFTVPLFADFMIRIMPQFLETE